MGVSLYEQYLAESPKATQPAAPKPSLYDEYVADQSRSAITVGPVALAPQDTPHYATPTIRATPESPSALRRVAGVAGELVTAPVRSALTLLDTPVDGEEISAARANRGKGGVIDPTGKRLRVGAPGGPAPVVSDANTSGAIDERELNRAGLETVGNAALSAIPLGALGRAADPAGSVLARVGAAGLRGAAHGAVVNAALGGAEGLALGDEQGTNRLSAAATGAERGALVGGIAGGLFGAGGAAAGEGLAAVSARRAAARAGVPLDVPTSDLTQRADALLGRVRFEEGPRKAATRVAQPGGFVRVDRPPAPGVLRAAPAPTVSIDEHLAALDAATPYVPAPEGRAHLDAPEPAVSPAVPEPVAVPSVRDAAVASGEAIPAPPESPAPVARPKATATSARFPSGKMRPLHTVSTEALLDEMDALTGKLERDEPLTAYAFTPDDNLHTTTDGRSVMHARRTARGTSQQAEATNRVGQHRAAMATVEAELSARGVDHSARYAEKLANPEAEEERRALAGVVGTDDSFDFGANLGEDYEERFSGFGLPKAARAAIKTAYRNALVTPYADIEAQHAPLAAALMRSGASSSKALHVATARVDDVVAGLSPEDYQHFGPTLVHSRLVHDADRAAAAALAEPDPTLRAEHEARADRFRQHADALHQQLPIGYDQQPHVQAAIQRHKDLIADPGTQDAIGAGVSPTSLIAPEHGYIKLVDQARVEDDTRRRVLKALAKQDVSQVQPRSAIGRALLGEKPGVRELVKRGALIPKQGAQVTPAQSAFNLQSAGYPGEPRAVQRQRVGITKSAQQAQGTARTYETDYRTIIAADARDKAQKAARNGVYREVAMLGRPLAAGEAPTGVNEVLSFDDARGLITTGTTTLPGAQRYEVPPEVHAAVSRYHQQTEGRIQTTAGRRLRAVTGALTHAQIAGMPVEATSHANTLASIVASVPGESSVGRSVTAALPGLGGKAAALREMYTVDFADPATRALEYRLADIGALRVEDHGPVTGLLSALKERRRPEAALNSSHHWLFGREGVDARGRLVLARKYLDRAPNASDEALRQFITGKLGNYVRANSGAAVNALQDLGISSFARFQAARIPTSIKAAVGISGLPTHSAAQAVTDHLATLYRGPVGHVLGANLLNYAATGHSTFANERGHSLDVESGLVATPEGMRWAGHHPEQLTAQYGEGARPIYVPGATLNPVAVGGLRASGLKALAFSPREGQTGRMADAERDMVNTGAGVLSPAIKFGLGAALGRTPYFQNDGSMLRTAQPRFNEDHEAADRVWEAAVSANPATGAMLGNAGEAGGRSLAGALSQDGKRFGGPQAIGARVAEFLLPRIASPGVGGLRNAAADENQKRFRKEEVMSAYKFRLRGAPGPEAADAIVQEATADAASVGMTGPALAAELRRYARMPDAARAAQAAKAARTFEGKYERAPSRVNDRPRTTYVPGP